MVSPILSSGCSPKTKVFDEFKPETVPAGNYELELWFCSGAAGEMQLEVRAGAQSVGSRRVVVEPGKTLKVDLPVQLERAVELQVVLTPVKSRAVINALRLSPVL